MAGITLDSGALIAVERANDQLEAYLTLAVARSKTLVIPSVVLAQVLRRPTSARLARVLRLAFVDPLTEHQAKHAGVLLGRSRTSDVVDAVVVVSAASRGDEIVTADMADISHLGQFVRSLGPIRDLTKLR